MTAHLNHETYQDDNVRERNYGRRCAEFDRLQLIAACLSALQALGEVVYHLDAVLLTAADRLPTQAYR